MAAISQTITSDAFSWMKSFAFWLQFHWNLILRVQSTITQHWLDTGYLLTTRLTCDQEHACFLCQNHPCVLPLVTFLSSLSLLLSWLSLLSLFSIIIIIIIVINIIIISSSSSSSIIIISSSNLSLRQGYISRLKLTPESYSNNLCMINWNWQTML